MGGGGWKKSGELEKISKINNRGDDYSALESILELAFNMGNWSSKVPRNCANYDLEYLLNFASIFNPGTQSVMWYSWIGLCVPFQIHGYIT